MKMRSIFWIGDSTVHENRIDTYPQTGMGQALGLYLKPEVRVRNLAQNGRSTRSFLEEGWFGTVEDEMEKGDFLFIQFGHNDNKPGTVRYTEPYGSFQEHLRFYIEEARSRGGIPVLLTPISRRHFDEAGVFLDGSHGEYPAAMKQVAADEGVLCIDLTEKTAEVLRRMGDQKSRPWFMHIAPGESWNPMYREGLADNTHLTWEGAVVMAGLAAQGLWEAGGEYRELLNEEASGIMANGL